MQWGREKVVNKHFSETCSKCQTRETEANAMRIPFAKTNNIVNNAFNQNH